MKKKVIRIKGRRYFSSKPKHGRPFVVCIECCQRKDVDKSGISDKEAAEKLWKLGWSIQPTYCPRHSKKKLTTQL